MLLWNDEAVVTLNNFNTNIFDCYLGFLNGPLCHFTAFYGAPATHNRIHSWTLLKRLKDVAPMLPWMIIGDFNEILYNSNKQGGSLRRESQMEEFRSVLDFCNLTELNFTGEPFTWTKSRHQVETIQERLDWCFTNDLWVTHFQPLSTSHLDFYSSDHRAIAVNILPLNLHQQQSARKTRFRFEKMWLKEEEAAALIKDNWKFVTSGDITHFQSNLSTCTDALQRWHHHKFGQMKKDISKMQKTVAQLNNTADRTQAGVTQLQQSEKILDELLAYEEEYWHQRSRVDWLQCGDKNTKYFHAKASSRKANNTIKSLTNDLGLTVTGKENLTQFLVFEVYLFWSNESDTKSGSDGMSAMFYQNYWDIVGSSVTQLVLGILNDGNDMTQLNNSIITLIPKVPNPSEESALALKRTLETYHKASGQLLNNDKSVMSFSPNTSCAQNFFLCNIRDAYLCHERYLGLPSYSGRDKQELFSNIKEKDRLIWHHSTSGSYNVKSGFHLATHLEDQLQSSSSDANRDWWKFFWNLSLPPKIRIFSWKVIQHILPVAVALFKRKVIDSAACSLCNSSWESIGHALFGCSHAKNIWKESKFIIDFHKAQSMFNGDYLHYLSAVYTQEDFELFICLLWGIWTDRNRVFHGGKARMSSSIISYTTGFHRDYSRTKHLSNPSTAAAAEHSSTHQNSTHQTLHQHTPWSPPNINGFKLNVDAASNSDQQKLGIGAIIRSHDGMVVAALSKVVQGSFRSDEMEAKALFHALNWVSQSQLSITHIETDALRVSTALNSTKSDLSCFSDLIFDIRCLLSFFPSVLVSHAKRSANQAAHGLAKFALGLDEDISWVGEIPYPIFTVVVNDLNL
uniref:Uncharacterized protein n=1 Tax=Cannabis sativa TaxID=3483 RepID=A0A803PQM1_CANSA